MVESVMKNKVAEIILCLVSITAVLTVTGCSKVHADDTNAGAPPEPNVVTFPDASLFTVDKPEQFPLAAATARPTTSELVVTGTVTPDVSKQVPVPSLATGRIVEI